MKENVYQINTHHPHSVPRSPRKVHFQDQIPFVVTC